MMVFSYGFNESAGLSGQNLRDSGAHSFSFTEACPDFDGKVTLEVMFVDVGPVAQIFNVEDRAEALISSWEEQIAEVAEAVPAGEPIRVFYFDSGEEAPFTALSGSVRSMKCLMPAPSKVLSLVAASMGFSAPGYSPAANWLGITQ